MKSKRMNIILTVVAAVLLAAIIGLYLYDVIVLKIPVTKNLFRFLSVSCILLASLIRLNRGGKRNGLDVYEKAYEKELGYAFSGKPMLRKKLLCACRLYNENNYNKALKYLAQLLTQAEYPRDSIPVLLFIALCFTDGGLPKEAIKAYYDLIKLDPRNSQAHSNLGRLFVSEGDFDSAFKHYDAAVTYDPKNYAAYVNRANLFFKMQKYDEAIRDGENALRIKNNGVEASSLLAIIYALLGNDDRKREYYHLSISSGRKPADLDAAIKHYLSEQQDVDADE